MQYSGQRAPCLITSLSAEIQLRMFNNKFYNINDFFLPVRKARASKLDRLFRFKLV